MNNRVQFIFEYLNYPIYWVQQQHTILCETNRNLFTYVNGGSAAASMLIEIGSAGVHAVQKLRRPAPQMAS